ncbi:MAG: hypothetical protein BGO69_02740 [Bacteroidetes bacterium 46-16]|nr:MAG: hypothetical protein BGO69_02740 [Bacteroidetes bacterium 46-16]
MIAKFRVFRAVDDVDGCDRYIDGHRRVLEAYGVSKVTSANAEWREDPFTYVIIAESEDHDRVFGGCRVQMRSETLKMPMEGAVAVLDKRIYDYCDEIGNYNVAEFCGLWNSKEVAGYGIGSMFLGRVAIAITPHLNLKHLMGLCSPATLRNSQKVGFEILRELGNNGTFYYPKEDLIATALIIKDVINLPLATEREREVILNLRNNPVQHSVERGPKGELQTYFDIRVNQTY